MTFVDNLGLRMRVFMRYSCLPSFDLLCNNFSCSLLCGTAMIVGETGPNSIHRSGKSTLAVPVACFGFGGQFWRWPQSARVEKDFIDFKFYNPWRERLPGM